MTMFKTPLDYVSGTTAIPKNAIGISPSQLARFFDKPHEWYRTEVLGEKGFTGSTASLLGTIIHFIAESYTKYQTVDKVEIYKYIYNQTVEDKSTIDKFKDLLEQFDEDGEEDIIEEFFEENSTHQDFDVVYILAKYKMMGNLLIKYLRRIGLPSKSEELVRAEIIPNYYVCGSCDAVKEGFNRGTIIDYKTVSGKARNLDKIPYGYKLQLLCYAYIYRQMGFNIDEISIIWITKPIDGGVSAKTGKPLKSYPSKVIQVTERINKEDFNFIESILKLVAESLDVSAKNPQLRHIIWKDWRLKQ